MAKFYGIGTGPGDSSLLTIKAVETLQNLDILYTPEAKKGGESLALSIVSKYLPDGLEIKSRHFPMNFNDSEKILAWNQIADEIVEDVKLGYSDPTVSGSNNFTKAMNSYNNAISTLNNATSKYINTTYVDKARSVGSVPNNPNSQSGYYTFTKFSSSYSGKLRDTDTNYETDYNQMKALNINNIDDYYWLASRDVISSSSNSNFLMRYVFARGSLTSYRLCYVTSNGNTHSSGNTYGLRPVFHLRSNIKVTGGTGEEGDPYTLGT